MGLVPGRRHGPAGESRVGRVDLLSDEEITVGLASLPSWTRAGGSITRTVGFADFRAAMLFTGAVAYLAEKANHHPDILIQWNKVTLTLSTHSAGGLTAADIALAGQLDELAGPTPAAL
jgi:4a-hydroxytetrahydrobiopterin dehydratase